MSVFLDYTTLLYVELAFRCVFGHASSAPLCNSSTSKPTLSGLHSYNQLLTRYFCLFYDFFLLHLLTSFFLSLFIASWLCICVWSPWTRLHFSGASHMIRVCIYTSLITQVVQIAKCESNLILASKRLAPHGKHSKFRFSAGIINEWFKPKCISPLIGTKAKITIDGHRGCEVGSKEFSSIFIYNIIRRGR